jgi:hypothetical protein
VAELTDISPNPFFSHLLPKLFFHPESDRSFYVLSRIVLELRAACEIWIENTPCMSQAPGYVSQKLDRYPSLFPFLHFDPSSSQMPGSLG